MARKKQEEEPCGSWMDTYGDMVTLLLTFFVMLFSMSSVNEEKFAVLVRAFTSRDPDSINLILDQSGGIEGEFPMNRGDEPPSASTLANATLEQIENSVPSDFDELYEYLKAYVDKSDMAGSVEVTREGDGVVMIRFQDNIFFEPDSAALKSSSWPILDFLGNCIKGVEDQVRTVNINGHTADPGIANYQVSDWLLSSQRAANVAIYFEEHKQIDPHKLLPIGYGKNFPVADNATAQGRQQNRRVDMLIISTESTLSAEALLSSILEGTFDSSLYPDEAGVEEVLTPPTPQAGSQRADAGSQEAAPPGEEG